MFLKSKLRHYSKKYPSLKIELLELVKLLKEEPEQGTFFGELTTILIKNQKSSLFGNIFITLYKY